MELYIFDKNLNFLGILDMFTSLLWNRRYFKSGDFELHCDLTSDNLSLLTKGNIVWKRGDYEAGYINYRNFKQDNEGKETLIVKGNLLTKKLNQRIIWGTVAANDKVENIMRKLVNDNCINPADSKRVIPNLILENLKNFTQSINYFQNKHPKLADEMEVLSTTSGLGHRVSFDAANKKLVFEVYQGVNRTVNQSVVSPCIFSKEFENVLEQEYTDSDADIENTCLATGTYSYKVKSTVTEMDGTTKEEQIDVHLPQTTTIGGNNIGIDRYETFVDGGDTQGDGDPPVSMAQSLSNLQQKGTSELAQHVEVMSFDSQINVYSNLVYKTDFDLGDVVTCISKKWGITLDTRITEIQEIYEEQGLQVNVTFGDDVPTLIDKIKQKIK